MAFKTSQMDQIALEYWYYGFLGRLRVDGRGFLHQTPILKNCSQEQKSSCRTYAEACHSPFKEIGIFRSMVFSDFEKKKQFLDSIAVYRKTYVSKGIADQSGLCSTPVKRVVEFFSESLTFFLFLCFCFQKNKQWPPVCITRTKCVKPWLPKVSGSAVTEVWYRKSGRWSGWLVRNQTHPWHYLVARFAL